MFATRSLPREYYEGLHRMRGDLETSSVGRDKFVFQLVGFHTFQCQVR